MSTRAFRPKLEVADIFRRHGAAWRATNAAHVNLAQRRVMTAIEICRTDALGGHVERCQDCEHSIIAYNSCRNRHCPKCQGRAAAAWLGAKEAELLPVPYFHFVFALPPAIGAMAYQNKAKVYGLLFKAASETLITIAADQKHLGADIGIIAVLHTWGQNLQHHPHVHCVVPGGGVSADGKRWINCRAWVLSSCACSFTSIPAPVPGGSDGGVQGWRPAILCRPRAPEYWQRYLPQRLRRCVRQNGSSMPRRRSPVLSSCWLTLRSTPTALRSRTIACSISTTPMSASAGGAISEAPGERIRPCALRLPSSCATSSSTSCRMAFIAFVTMDCWQTAIAPKSLRCADACSLRPFRRRLARRKATTIWAPVVISHRHALAAAVVSE